MWSKSMTVLMRWAIPKRIDVGMRRTKLCLASCGPFQEQQEQMPTFLCVAVLLLYNIRRVFDPYPFMHDL